MARRTYKRDKVGRFAGGGGVLGGIRRATAARKQRKTNKRIKRHEGIAENISAELSRGGSTSYSTPVSRRGKAQGPTVARFNALTPTQRRKLEADRADSVRIVANLRAGGRG